MVSKSMWNEVKTWALVKACVNNSLWLAGVPVCVILAGSESLITTAVNTMASSFIAITIKFI